MLEAIQGFLLGSLPHYLGLAYVMTAAFSCGAMGFSALLNLSLLRKYRMGFNSVAAYRVFMAMGWILTIGTLLWLTLPTVTAGTQFTVYYFLYMVGLFSGSLGATGLALKNVQIHVQLEARVQDQLEEATVKVMAEKAVTNGDTNEETA